MKNKKLAIKRKCPVCKGRARWFTCSENKVGPSECPVCEGTGWISGNDPKAKV